MIDVAFDVRDDANGGDPDKTSATLRRYHHLLWSKALPGGRGVLELVAPGRSDYFYLHHVSHLGEFRLSSDTVVPTFRSYRRAGMPELLARIPDEVLDDFQYWNHTIGGMMVFPKGVGRMTLNGARGFNPLIRDRFDLTVECIRRHYAGLDSPLSGILTTYGAFFDLFGDFDGYVEFFLLDDLIAPDGAVRFFLPFERFGVGTLPTTVEEYEAYRVNAVAFLRARNERIDEWARANLAA